MDGQPNFRVLIIGGGIAGLTLAIALQHADIEFVIIEKGDRLDPQVGASIGVLPNAARILDQLQCFDELEAMTVAMNLTSSRREDGSIIGEASDVFHLMRVRTGYPIFFIDRQLLLRVLASRIIQQDRVLLRTLVESVEQGPDKAVVTLTDGMKVQGDIVVGADGVHSLVRKEMWRHAEHMGDGEKFGQDKKAMFAEYMCLFGISIGWDDETPGNSNRTYAKNMSTLSYVGKDGRISWFIFVKMNQTYRHPNIPRYSNDDARTLVNRIGSLAIKENGSLTLNDLYASNVACKLVPIEEAEHKHWSYGRLVCLGDSAHKGTPNLGAGGSSAIESAAALSNVLVSLAASSTWQDLASVILTLQKYQEIRALRVKQAMRYTNSLTRLQALKSHKEYIITHHIAPRMENSTAESFSNFIIGAEKVNHLPIPPRSLQGTMPYNPKSGWGYQESKVKRAKMAVPLLIIAIVAGLFSSLASGLDFSPASTFYHQRTNPKISCLASIRVYPSVFYGVCLLEATRSNNKGSLLQFPMVVGFILQIFLPSTVSSLYLALLYISTPMQAFRAADNRLTDASYAITTGPLVTVLVLLPQYLLCCLPSSPLAYVSGWVIASQPYLISAAQYLLSRSVLPSTFQRDRLYSVRNDISKIRLSIGLLLSMSILARICTFSSSLNFWDPDDYFSAASVLFWLLIFHYELRRSGRSKSLLPFVFFPVCATMGPAILLAAGWFWREEALISGVDKDAVTKQSEELRKSKSV